MLKDDFHKKMRLMHLAKSTEKNYWNWVKRFAIRFNVKSKEQLVGLSEKDIELWLSELAEYCSASTQNQALQAILFLLNNVLDKKLNRLNFTKAKKYKSIPVAFTYKEVIKITNQLSGDYKLIALIMFGSGLRLNETLNLRVNDVDFGSKSIWVRNAKGSKDRKAFLPESIIHLLKHQVAKAELLLNEDILNNFSGCTMPDNLERKFSSSNKSFAWQYIFPQPNLVKNMRHHQHPTKVQKAVKKALQAAKINKKGSCHSFRHSFACEYLRRGGNIKKLQLLLGHGSLRSTEIYSNIVDLPENNVSPLDSNLNTDVKVFKISA